MKRFWDKVDKSGDCWEWTACKNNAGYGNFKIGGRVVNASRFVLSLEGVEAPDGMCVCHHCDNPGCVNPDHLFVGTYSDNMYDMHSKRRHHKEPKALTKDQARVIRKVFQRTPGTGQSRLANYFGVSQTTISRVLRGKIWREAA